MSNQINQQDRLDVDGAAAFLGLTKGTLYQWIHARKIPHFKLGSRVVFSKKELQEFLDSKRVEPLEPMQYAEA